MSVTYKAFGEEATLQELINEFNPYTDEDSVRVWRGKGLSLEKAITSPAVDFNKARETTEAEWNQRISLHSSALNNIFR